MTSYTPISFADTVNVVKKTTVLDVMRRLLQTKNVMVSDACKKGMFLSILNIIQGDVDPSLVHKSLQRIRERKLATFVPWAPASIQVAISKKSPYLESGYKVSGVMLANHTSIVDTMKQILDNYSELIKKKAFLKNFLDKNLFKNNDLTEFEDSHEVVQSVIDDYYACERPDYLEWGEGLNKDDDDDFN